MINKLKENTTPRFIKGKTHKSMRNVRPIDVNCVIDEMNAELESLESQISVNKPFKVFKALINQTGTAAPTVVTVGENTLGLDATIGVNPMFSYSDVGIYIITSAGAFPEYKTELSGKPTLVTFILGSRLVNQAIQYGQNDGNSLYMNTYDATSGNLEDNILNGWDTWIEIRVYD